ncbi:hypothetical protein LSAT2_027262 [Lamellibrachia satsuma]|nr:hypothetical protein LSAT2_027262 [Lamellibrachia satsuma]
MALLWKWVVALQMISAFCPLFNTQKMSIKSIKQQGTLSPVAKTNQRILKIYEQVCAITGTVMCPSVEKALQNGISEELYLETWMVHKTAGQKTPVEGKVSLAPVIETLRKGRYIHITKLLVWNLAMEEAAVVAVADLLCQKAYLIKQLELIDCLLIKMGYAFSKLVCSFKSCESLTTILLDYNEFGDAACEELCTEMFTNTHVLVLSLKYCGITHKSGATLAELVARTRLQELYLDGNDLGIMGTLELITPLADQIYRDNYMKEELARLQEQQDDLAKAASLEGGSILSETLKPKKKGKKKKVPVGPPSIGPWIAKLSLKANDIHYNPHVLDPSAFECIQMCARMVAGSEALRDLDFRDNHIGEAGAKEFMAALEERIAAQLPPIRIQVSRRMSHDAFCKIYELGSGKPPKKKKGKKKKK